MRHITCLAFAKNSTNCRILRVESNIHVYSHSLLVVLFLALVLPLYVRDVHGVAVAASKAVDEAAIGNGRCHAVDCGASCRLLLRVLHDLLLE